MIVRLALVLGLCLVSGGCAQLPVSLQDTALIQRESLWQQRQAAIADYLTWDITGRLAVRAGDQAGSATKVRQRRDQTSRIDLIGAFGGQRLKIVVGSNGASLQSSSDRLITGPTAEAVLYQALGWQVPFTQLGYWLRGLPGPQTAEATEVDKSGKLLKLVQSGWEVNYLDYQNYDSVELPRKIYARALSAGLPEDVRAGAGPETEFTVKIIIKRWQKETTGEDESA